MPASKSFNIPDQGPISEVFKQQVIQRFQSVQDMICDFLNAENQNRFREDVWAYETGKGGGRTRVYDGGRLLEKGGVNFSAIEGGSLPASAATAFQIAPGTPYFATGVSLVLHPHNPHAPTVHLNIRFFAAGNLWWFGGGMDLTPYYPQREYVVAWHQGLKDLCQAHGRSHQDMKKACDDYFFLKHRQEARGVGGIFFDHLHGDAEKDFAFTAAVGEAFPTLYKACIAHRDLPFTPDQRSFQLMRRGRYVEFNLVYDRGTLFGLQSNGRMESILMSLPPQASWVYDYRPIAGSAEAALTDYWLKPRNWADGET
jgi:coproporphyrinogen III oxidase